jgi:hypothetical protein
MEKLSVRDLEVKGRRALVRVDFNVPTEEVDGVIRITDDTRMRESLPNINLLRERGAKVVLLAHFGRPKGKPNPKYLCQRSVPCPPGVPTKPSSRGHFSRPSPAAKHHKGKERKRTKERGR